MFHLQYQLPSFSSEFWGIFISRLMKQMSYWWILCYECFYLDESLKFNDSTSRSRLVASASRRVNCGSVFGRSWRRCKCLHKSALSEENSVILSATWPSTPPPKLLSVLSSKLLKAQLIYFSWHLFDRAILGCLDSRVLHIDSEKRVCATAGWKTCGNSVQNKSGTWWP